MDLNLKLMCWQILPELDLEWILHTHCLFLGAGMLSCYVVRGLMVRPSPSLPYVLTACSLR